MKKIFISVSLLLLMLFLASCGKKGRAENEFLFATWAAGTELREFNDVIRRVNEKADGEYTVSVQSIPADYYIKLSSMISANNAPDFFWLTQELISKYADLGAALDITSWFEDSDVLVPDDFFPGVLNSATYQGKYWGLPWIANPIMIYLNEDLFNLAGVELPSATADWTWEEFIDICREFKGMKTADGKDIYGCIVDGWPNIETFIWSGGGDILADDGTVLIDSEESLRGLANLHTIITEGLTPKYSEVGSLGSNNVWFEKGRVAMFMGGVQDNFEYKQTFVSEEERFPIKYAPMPKAPDGGQWAFDWTASTIVSPKVKNKDLAYKALEALTLEFFTWKLAPPIIGGEEKIKEIAPLKEDAFETIVYTLQFARSANYLPEWSKINDKLWYDLYLLMLQNKSNFNYETETRKIANYTRNLLKE